MSLDDLKFQELNTVELSSVHGGGPIRDSIIGYVVEKVIDFASDAFVHHCDSGAGYGGSMDRLGKL